MRGVLAPDWIGFFWEETHGSDNWVYVIILFKEHGVPDIFTRA